MKRIILATALVLTLTAAVAAPQQDTATVDTTTQVDEVEAFSDTTTVDTTTTASVVGNTQNPWDQDWDEFDVRNSSSFLESVGIEMSDLTGMFFVLAILFLLFILAPVAIIGLILYFIYKNRKDRMRLAEMAMKSGKAIPLDVMGSPIGSTDALWNKGIKQLFLGAGLAILLWMFIGKIGFGIGALVMLLGCGNLVIAHQERQKQSQKEMFDNFFRSEKSEQ